MNHKFPTKFSFPKGQTEIHLQCENGCGVELIRSKTTSKVQFKHVDGKLLSYAPICKPIAKKEEPAIVVPSEALHMQEPVKPKDDHEWKFGSIRGAYDEYECTKGCTCKKLVFGSGVTIYMSALGKRTENRPACVPAVAEVKPSIPKPVTEKKEVVKRGPRKHAEFAPLHEGDGDAKENKIRYDDNGNKMHRFPRVAIKSFPAGINQVTVVCVDCGCRCIKYKSGGVAYVNREGIKIASGVKCTPDQPYEYKEEIARSQREVNENEGLDELKEEARRHNEITGHTGGDIEDVSTSVDVRVEEEERTNADDEEEVMTISDIEDVEIPVTAINPKINIPTDMMTGRFGRLLSETKQEFDNSEDKGGLTEESPLRTPIIIQAKKGNSFTHTEARLQESLVLIKCMYEDMVKHNLRTKVRDMAGRFLYSHKFQEAENYLNDQQQPMR